MPMVLVWKSDMDVIFRFLLYSPHASLMESLGAKEPNFPSELQPNHCRKRLGPFLCGSCCTLAQLENFSQGLEHGALRQRQPSTSKPWRPLLFKVPV